MASTNGREEFDTSAVPIGKPLDANKYATKKTIAQGMLDIALLTANASQLKYVLQIGNQHEFYHVMLTLISLSIVLQICVGVLSLSLNLMRDCRLHLESHRTSALVINNVSLGLVFLITVLNILVSPFEAFPRPTTTAVAAL